MRYEGEWRNGQEHGVGTLVEPDGSAYYGFWSQGKLHGEGVLLSCPHPCSLTGMDPHTLHCYL